MIATIASPIVTRTHLKVSKMDTCLNVGPNNILKMLHDFGLK